MRYLENQTEILSERMGKNIHGFEKPSKKGILPAILQHIF